MNTIASLLQTPLFESIGWALIHLSWQATIVSLLLAAVITTFRPRTAATRYVLAVAALAVVALLPVATAVHHYANIRPAEDGAATVTGAAGAIESRYALTVSELSRAALRDLASALKADLYRILTAAVPYLLVVWSFGVALFSLRLAAAWVQARRLSRDGLTPAPRECVAALERISAALGIQQNVRLFVSAIVEVPSVIGYVRPMILLPISCISGLTVEQLESVIAHELAHVRRYDFAVNFLQTIVETLFFFHPAVWWISAQIRTERENACDDLAVEVCGDARVYANALTLLEQLRPRFANVSVAATGGCLLARIRRLLKIDSGPEQFSTRWFAGFAVAAAAAIVAMALPFGLAAQASKVVPQEERSATSEPSRPAGTTIDVIASGSDEEAGDARDEELNNRRDDVRGDRSEHDFDFDFDFESDPADLAPHAEIAAGAAARARQALASHATSDASAAAEAYAPSHAAFAADVAAAYAIGGVTATLCPEELKRMRVAGVDLKLVETLANAGFDEASFRQLKQLRDLGVTPEYVKTLRSVIDVDEVEELAQLRAHGVDATYARALAAAGFEFDSDELAEAKSLGVSPTFAREMRRRLEVDELDDIKQLRALGVSVRYIDELNAAGFRHLDADEISGARALGVNKAFVDSLRSAGLTRVSLDDAMELRALGVTAADVRRARRATRGDLEADDVKAEKHRRIEEHARAAADREARSERAREERKQHKKREHVERSYSR